MARRAALLLFSLILLCAASAAAQTIVVPTFAVGDEAQDTEVAVGADGHFTFVWTDYANSTNAALHRLYTRSFTPDGVASEPVRVDLNGRLSMPSLAALEGGGYVFAARQNPAATIDRVVGRRLSSAGVGVGDLVLVDPADSLPFWGNVTTVSSGPLFVWRQGSGYRMRRYDSSLQALGPYVDIGAAAPGGPARVAPLPSGGFLVVRHEADGTRLLAHSYSASGTPLGEDFEVADRIYTERIAVSPAGEVALVGWRDTQIWLYRFTETGAPVGSPILVVDAAPVSILSADVAYDPYGNPYVAWAGFSQDPVAYLPVWARAYDGNTGNSVGAPLQLAAAGFNPRLARLANGNFVNSWTEAWGHQRASITSVCGVTLPACGNGVIDPPCEACDAGAANSDVAPDACRTTCRPAGCGDGVIDSGEECDDGGRFGGDGCDQNCLAEVCGNGRREGGESCDDGNLLDGDGCDSNCTVTTCGNGILAGAEECDDGGLLNGDGCDDTCLVEQCPGGRVEGDEECDDGNTTDGDGCDTNCTTTRCDNGVRTDPEECDDGNDLNGDGCDRSCLVEQCGNGRLEGDEVCDDGNASGGDGCENDCTRTPRIDSVLLPLRPLTIFLSAAAPSVTQTVRATIRNADPAALRILRLTASDGTCPAGTVSSAPDFSLAIPGVQDAAALNPGGKATAQFQVQVTRAAFAGAQSSAPRRCAIDVAVGPTVAGVTVDETPSNDTLHLAVDVFDRAVPAAGAEAFLRSAKPVSLRIPPGKLAAERAVRVRARSTQAGATFTFAVSDGDCPPGTATLDQVNAAAGTALLRLRASRAFFTTTHRLSPGRCSPVVTALSSADADPGNNGTAVVVDVQDDNDS